MAIILDSDVLIRAEKQQFDLYGWLQERSQEPVEIAAITVAEIRHGVERASGEQRHRREQFVEDVIDQLPIIPYTEEVAREHARVWSELETRGQMIGYYDLIIAATARLRGSQLATFNRRHFEKVTDLQLFNFE